MAKIEVAISDDYWKVTENKRSSYLLIKEPCSFLYRDKEPIAKDRDTVEKLCSLIKQSVPFPKSFPYDINCNANIIASNDEQFYSNIQINYLSPEFILRTAIDGDTFLIKDYRNKRNEFYTLSYFFLLVMATFNTRFITKSSFDPDEVFSDIQNLLELYSDLAEIVYLMLKVTTGIDEQFLGTEETVELTRLKLMFQKKCEEYLKPVTGWSCGTKSADEERPSQRLKVIIERKVAPKSTKEKLAKLCKKDPLFEILKAIHHKENKRRGLDAEIYLLKQKYHDILSQRYPDGHLTSVVPQECDGNCTECDSEDDCVYTDDY